MYILEGVSNSSNWTLLELTYEYSLEDTTSPLSERWDGCKCYRYDDWVVEVSQKREMK